VTVIVIFKQTFMALEKANKTLLWFSVWEVKMITTLCLAKHRDAKG